MTGRYISLCTGALAAIVLLAGGCNETTHEDVTAARQKVEREQRKLEDMKREDARAIQEEKNEAKEARATSKPIVGDDVNEGVTEEEREARKTEQNSNEREANQEERVKEAKRELETTKEKLGDQVARDKFAADARLHIDHANRSIEKLQVQRNAADDEGKKSIDVQIKELQDKRDFLEKKIDDMEAAELTHWQDHKDAVSKTAKELHDLANKVS
jgi:outer membrane murein-binding lipoprotein Lpp